MLLSGLGQLEENWVIGRAGNGTGKGTVVDIHHANDAVTFWVIVCNPGIALEAELATTGRRLPDAARTAGGKHPLRRLANWAAARQTS